ncbi:MAG: SsrA-binding protein [Planctomycetota bacterium]|jgi:SsrA-binding protein
MGRESDKLRVISTNRKAFHDYHVLDELVCGVELVGTEVKSLRDGHAVIGAAYGQIRSGELFLLGASIPEYSHGNLHNHKPERERRLLARRKEIDKWFKQVREKGVTIVPLDIHFEGHLVKVKMALVRGKRLFDKRAADKEKSIKQDMRRALGRQR